MWINYSQIILLFYFISFTAKTVPKQMVEASLELVRVGVVSGLIDKDFQYHDILQEAPNPSKYELVWQLQWRAKGTLGYFSHPSGPTLAVEGTDKGQPWTNVFRKWVKSSFVIYCLYCLLMCRWPIWLYKYILSVDAYIFNILEGKTWGYRPDYYYQWLMHGSSQ